MFTLVCGDEEVTPPVINMNSFDYEESKVGIYTFYALYDMFSPA